MIQTQKVEEDLHVALPNNPFVPPSGDVCFINSLPPELLSRIFEVGSADDGTEDEDDVSVDCWENLCRNWKSDAKGDNEKDGDIEIEGEVEDADEEGDEEWTDEENDSDATGSSHLSPSWPPFPIVVSHVCRHWRNIAFSTPSLWTTIVVPSEARPPYEFESTLLERSKSLPVDIYINCEPDDDDDSDSDIGPPSDADLESLFSILVPHIHRWRTMEVAVAEYRNMYVFLSAVSDPSIPPASQLKTLELYHHEEMEEFDNFGFPCMSKHFTLFGGSAPLLVKVVLWGVHVDWNQPWIASSSNLTDLELAFHPEDVRPSWTQFVTILRGAFALEKLSLRQSGPSGEPPEWFIEPTPGGPADINAPIQLLRVTDLILAFHSQARAIGLLRKLYLPAIKSLTLDFDEGDYTDFVHELAGPATSLVTQEQPHSLLSMLEKLKIAGLPCDPPCIELLYGELQNLTSLTISLSYLPHFFLDILATSCRLPGRSSAWLPRLTTLYVSGTFGTAVRYLVEKRREAGVPLSSLYVEESCDVEDEDIEWLKKNVEIFDFFEGSDDDDDVVDFEDLHEEIDMW